MKGKRTENLSMGTMSREHCRKREKKESQTEHSSGKLPSKHIWLKRLTKTFGTSKRVKNNTASIIRQEDEMKGQQNDIERKYKI